MDPSTTDPDMLIAEYDAVDEKPEPAVIHPDDAAEEPESEPLANDYEAMKARFLAPFPDLEIEGEAVSTWTVENYRNLQQKERGPTFECEAGNNVEAASLYLEQGREEGNLEDKPREEMTACVQFTLVLWNKNDPSIYTHHSMQAHLGVKSGETDRALAANHRFTTEESDWGFTRFAELRKMFAPQWEGKGRPMVENESVNVTAYVRAYKDPTGVLWHNFQNYNSKKETGMVGLKNQGATCYLNSLLQSLYFTNAFRKAVYQIPTNQDSDRAKSAWALQRLFYQVQTNEDAVSTQELTQSFGWETRHIFEQQDVQELTRILMERMEERMKGTEAENALAKMFSGKMKTYISCINVDYESSRIEDFWDLQLNVSGNKNLDDSFRDYIQVETMDGENKYYAEGFGLQEARKGVIFDSFPQVLHLQLKRFEYDLNRDATMKINDRYEFPETFDATPYLSDTADKSEPYIYNLHSVLVHSGDFNAGHYYAFLRPSAEDQFYKFDDDRVTRATLKESMEENFGGDYTNKPNGVPVRNPYTRTLSTKRSMSAYMLVYIRQSRRKHVLHEVSETDPPPHLAQQLQEERAAVERRRKEREEQHLYLSIWVVTEDNFRAHQGFDLTSWDADNDTPSKPLLHRVLRASTVAELTQKVAESQNIAADHIRLWVMVNRQNKTVRPDQPLEDPNMTIENTYVKHGARDRSFRLWAEQASVFDNGKPVWPDLQVVNKNDPPILIFLKHFDAEQQTLMGVGHVYLKKHSKVSDMFPLISQIMGWTPKSTNLTNGLTNGAISTPTIALYEEIKSSMIEPMKPKATLQHAEIQDGDIVCFQKQISEKQTSMIAATGSYTDAREFYDYLLNRKQVTFSPRGLVEDPEATFKLDLSRRMSYEQYSAKVGEKLKVDPTHIRFSTVNSVTLKPKAIVRRNAAQSLSQVLSPSFGTYGNSNQRDDALYYEVLEMSLSELDTRKNLKVVFLTEGQSREELHDILVPKMGVISDLVDGLAKKASLNKETMQNLRIYEISSGRIHREYRMDTPLTTITEYSSLVAEVIPEEERNLEDDDVPICCFHFDKEPNKAHGIPFKFVIKPGEVFSKTKERLSKRTGLKGKQFEKIRFAVIQRSIYAKPIYLDDENIVSDVARPPDDCIGLDHVNRSKAFGGKGDSMFIR
ncbi:uncharacterized protein KY384_005267 [Bacidia gigantensis]|uniref:uncharacterized protein n=1 Tax=Bacidia gigantensis TaxID=2732470 RepID=UPI001D046498|nr:uncharacterized protein KY384_005267 [Bacidia gigantensis]KAG8529786.1 hypothetical protein KY384_005267 [Bacidia gigantensis]